ncbi:MAG: membrane protein insertase YidC [Armatimonadetes bacterium]|nr:membrane protein insertase YidC [Armatimonadota bacterium]
MSQARPRGNFLQTILITTVIWLGLVLVFQRPNQNNANVGKTSTELMNVIRDDNANIREMTMMSTIGGLTQKLEEEQKKQIITPEQKEKALLHAEILHIDAQLKASILRLNRGEGSDHNLLQLAYNKVKSLKEKYEGKPLWTESFDVADVSANKLYGWKSWTLEGLYDKVKTQLMANSKTNTVLGFIPGYYVIDFLVGMTGRSPGFSYAFATLLLAVLVRAIIYKFTQRQLMWSRQMQQLQPMIQEIKAQYTDKKTKQVTDPQALNMKTMELYKEYGINPLAGCAPMAIQMPLFLIVYQCMLAYQFEFTKGTFLWMNPSAHAASSFFAENLGGKDNIMIALYGITMITSTLLMPVSDPSQAKTQKGIGVGMGVLFTVFMFFNFFPVPGAFVLYWTFTNIFATLQSLRAYRMPAPPLVKVNAAGGGVIPGSVTRKETFMDRMAKKFEEAQELQEKRVRELKGDKPEDGGEGKDGGMSSAIRPNGKPKGPNPGSGSKDNEPRKPKKRPQ